ncbi:MAG: hypothetical protein ACR2OG_12465 [Gemmatimonadaceae bacterium]
MTDAELVRAAIDASGLSARAWAEQVMVRDERTVRRWLAGRPVPETVRRRLLAARDDSSDGDADRVRR